ncbi:MAG: GtrA family protein [Chloroflexi bacterium]|nr:GtrA family protein [Chloroflexota bacterium]
MTLVETIAHLRAKTPKEQKRFIKFLIVGALGFAVDFGGFNLFHFLKVGPTVAGLLFPPLGGYLLEHPEIVEQSLSFSCAVLSNFIWNYFWIYPEAREANQARKIMMFVVISVAGLIIGIPVFTAALFVAKNIVASLSLDNLGFNLAGNMALVCRVVVLLFWNFFANRKLTYGDVK